MAITVGEGFQAMSPLRALVVALLSLSASLAVLPPAAPVAAADETAQALSRINSYRAWAGLPPIRRNPALDAAATAHARYYQLNYGDAALSGMGLHEEQLGKPGFTGATMQDRATAQGYAGSVNENIGLSGDLLTSLDWFIGSINHRLTLIDPRYLDIGFGVVNDGKAMIEVIDVGAASWSNTASPEWVAWPPNGTSGVGLSFSGETPNPFPSAGYPVGYPITLKYFGGAAVSFSAATLTTNGQSLPLISATGSGWLTRQTFQIAATAPLRPATTYTVTVNGTLSGTPFSRSWSFRTASQSSEPLANPRDLPAGVAAADVAVQNQWLSADGPVRSGISTRTWLWGPDTFAATTEAYAESAGGKRAVYYFDKARMEITDPSADRNNPWFVTNGLLVRDLIAGQVQIGEAGYLPAQPARQPLAGDAAVLNPDAPTYASLTNLRGAVSDQTGLPVINTLARDGSTALDAGFAGVTALNHYDPVTGHNVAAMFWDWMNGQGWDALAVVGRPLAEPYWVRVRVKGVEQPVLVQAFERRVITYTPANDPAWRIEMGNVGQHYFTWRYGGMPS